MSLTSSSAPFSVSFIPGFKPSPLPWAFPSNGCKIAQSRAVELTIGWGGLGSRCGTTMCPVLSWKTKGGINPSSSGRVKGQHNGSVEGWAKNGGVARTLQCPFIHVFMIECLGHMQHCPGTSKTTVNCHCLSSSQGLSGKPRIQTSNNCHVINVGAVEENTIPFHVKDKSNG